MKSKLWAGTGEITITPPLGLPLLGALKPATGIHDDLFARALIIGDETCSAAVVCLDLVGLDMRTADEMRSEIAGRTGIWSVPGWEGCLKEGSRWR
ncbi:MAG: hypothetical protein IT210_03060 [Armatimonadetes bacterium]|nr:hypothetical protein [Armatimonadota bacterium]